MPRRNGRRPTYERMASGPSGLAYSKCGELVVNMRGAELYRFAAMRDVLAASAPLQATAMDDEEEMIRAAIAASLKVILT